MYVCSQIEIYILFRSPFDGDPVYEKRKDELVELSIRLATIGQRDMFVENQATVIRDNCRELGEIADDIIQVGEIVNSVIYGEQNRVLLAGTDVSLHLLPGSHNVLPRYLLCTLVLLCVKADGGVLR